MEKSTMDNTALQSMIRSAVESKRFRPLFDYLADDVEFNVMLVASAPTSGERRGKQAVIDYFTSAEDSLGSSPRRSTDVIRSDERVVVVGDHSFRLEQTGMAVRNEYAFVFDVRDGLITRLLIHQDLSASMGTRRAASRANGGGG
jgi:uncharacterized protein